MRRSYIPAMRFHFLTGIYDPIVALTSRENTFKKRLVEQAAIRPGERVLDVGCGTGTLALMLKSSCRSAEVKGLDADRSVLLRARSKAARAGSDVQFLEAIASAIPVPDGSVQKVTSSLFFHHLSDESKLDVFREISRVLAINGELHVVDWGRARSPLMRAGFLAIQLLDGFASTRANVQGRLIEMMAATGFSEIRETATLSTMFGTLSMYRARRLLIE